MKLKKVHSIFFAQDTTDSKIYAHASDYHGAVFELKYNFIRNFYRFLDEGNKTENEICDFIEQEIAALTEDLPTY